ncbi:hypothetical protein [Vibrio owensii]|uniref:Uncharacterized protein n=1 Tax=Vibrio owensii CAIM 1854 = LMG 25443 TaxID=1229493 RepID=A0A0C1VS90_9VIBR|nr:hypothetical protein [Vibrio owensii]KIF46862.1 hypothetical protein H735_28450 [Vibrio owensii CAIM 1854 = LMG 25443]
MKKVKLGFYAVKFGSVALCHGASLVVTHDKSTLRELAPVCKGHVNHTVYLQHVSLGAEYDFDAPAFNVLKEHIELNKFTPCVLDEVEPIFHRVKLAV